MIQGLIKKFEFWVFAVLVVASIVFTAVDLVSWEIVVPVVVAAGVALGVIGKKRAAAKNGG